MGRKSSRLKLDFVEIPMIFWYPILFCSIPFRCCGFYGILGKHHISTTVIGQSGSLQLRQELLDVLELWQ